MKPFDPFEDRLARDIRNGLSEAFVSAIEGGDLAGVLHAARQFQNGTLSQAHMEYIEKRLRSYREAIHALRKQKSDDVVGKALILWDMGLFFEVHECLEAVWRSSSGEKRLALQGLIRAAGAYVHIEQGNIRGALKMARKARAALADSMTLLQPHAAAVKRIMDGLSDLDQPPPKVSVGA